MKNWKKAIALVASAAALVSVAACGSSNAGGSSDSGKKTVGSFKIIIFTRNAF